MVNVCQLRPGCGMVFHSPGVGFLAGPKLLDFYETAIVHQLLAFYSVSNAPLLALCALIFFVWRALRARYINTARHTLVVSAPPAHTSTHKQHSPASCLGLPAHLALISHSAQASARAVFALTHAPAPLPPHVPRRRAPPTSSPQGIPPPLHQSLHWWSRTPLAPTCSLGHICAQETKCRYVHEGR